MALFALSKDLKSVQQAPGTFEDIKDVEDLFDEVKARINGNMEGLDLLTGSVTSREIAGGTLLRDDLQADTAKRLGLARTAAPARKLKSELAAVAQGTVATSLVTHTHTMEHTRELLLVSGLVGINNVLQNQNISLEINATRVTPVFTTAMSNSYLMLSSPNHWLKNNTFRESIRTYAFPLKAGVYLAPTVGNTFTVRLRGFGASASTWNFVRLYTQLIGFD